MRRHVDDARIESRRRREEVVPAGSGDGLRALLREVFSGLSLLPSLHLVERESAQQQMVILWQGRAQTRWHLLFVRDGAVVRLGKESAARRVEFLQLLPRHAAGSEDGKILGELVFSTRAGAR